MLFNLGNSLAFIITVALLWFVVNDPSTTQTISVSRYARAMFISVPIIGFFIVLFPKKAADLDLKYWLGKPSPPVGFYKFFGWFLIVTPVIIFIALNRILTK